MKTLLTRAILVLTVAVLWIGPSRAAEPAWPDHLVIGTASVGGTYYVYGETLAKPDAQPRFPVVRAPTEGPVQNIELIESGEARLGFVTIGVALQAWNGTGVSGRKEAGAFDARNVPMYDTPLQFLVLQDTGIRTVAEMAGKRVGIGPRGGTSAAYFPELFKVLGVQANFTYGEWADLAVQVRERKLDVLAVGAGVPFPSFVELEAKDRVRYVALTAAEIAAARLAMPELTPSRIPAGTYPSLLRHYETIGLYNFAVAHEQLPDDLVYQVVKAVFENHEEMMEGHAAAAATIPKNIDRNSFLPLHPGAIRYYRQIGRAGQSD